MSDRKFCCFSASYAAPPVRTEIQEPAAPSSSFRGGANEINMDMESRKTETQTKRLLLTIENIRVRELKGPDREVRFGTRLQTLARVGHLEGRKAFENFRMLQSRLMRNRAQQIAINQTNLSKRTMRNALQKGALMTRFHTNGFVLVARVIVGCFPAIGSQLDHTAPNSELSSVVYIIEASAANARHQARAIGLGTMFPASSEPCLSGRST